MPALCDRFESSKYHNISPIQICRPPGFHTKYGLPGRTHVASLCVVPLKTDTVTSGDDMADQLDHMSREKTILSFSEEESFRIGFLLGAHIHFPLIIALMGELGAGKTHLTQGIARGLGVSEAYYITSPSYSLINEYPGRLKLYHIDLYRLEDTSELDELGIDEILTSEAVSVIEWAERLGPLSPDHRLDIFIEIIGDTKRKFCFTTFGQNAGAVIDAFLSEGIEGQRDE